ncbi:hypothetical protein EsDP_00006448 [Epichloe bromicola]|uniref:Flo11 n=1 Tax=Epichloe bromicola TaxID=79588 RepID=A0ABQ0CXM1_9HYPO
MDSNWSFGASGMTSPRHVRSRTQSISSDRQSTIGFGLVLPPLSVAPESCFIAVSAASQIITNDHDSHADAWYDQNGIEPAMETATISGPALRLVNDFLDQLLLNFLQLSKSTNLSALRPAIIEVLKPKLAKDAISNADEELKEYLGGGNEDDFVKPQGPGFHKIGIWSWLGSEPAFDISDIVSPAVAIFLTSVLEYMGELTLTVAGQAAYQRVRTKIERELKEGSRNPSAPADRIVVSDSDMERVALDRTLGRLWRGWKKRMRTPANDVIGRPFSKALSVPSKQEYGAPGQSMTALPRSATGSDGSNEPRKSQEHLEQPIVEDVQAADIPLPVTDDDVNEIEVPGLAHYSDEETDAEADEEERTPKRPRSLLLPSSMTLIATRTRSLSVPTRAVPSFYSPRTRKHSRISAPGSEATPDNAADAEDSQSDESEYNDAAEQVAYEKAEIMTSSRVSVSGSCYSAETDANSKHKHGPPRKRSSSVHSARIIDVVAPKSPSPRSPAHSRPGSLDGKSDGLRSATLSGVAAAAAAAASASAAITSEDGRETPGQKPAGQAMSKGPTHNTSISETDETRAQTQQPSTREPGRNRALPDALAMSAAGSINVPTKGRKKAPPGKINTKLQTYAHEHEHEQAPPSARAVPLPVTPANYAAEEEGVPGLPPRASGHGGRQSPRTESNRGIVTIERTRTHESDEVSLPLQSGPNSRQVHTAASSVSSATSRLKLVRTSEDDSSRSESVARNFEELIQSNQTITYTLTPENMRDVDAKSPVVTKFARRKSEDVRALNSPKFPPSNSGRQPSPRLPSVPSSPKIVEGKTPIATKPSGSGPRAPTGLVISTSRESAALAREARVPTDTTTSDFAEFIKFTGPADESKAHTVPRLASPVSPGKSVRDSRRASTTSSLNRARHQPRDAAVDSRADNSDLIDFIRQGPPIAPSNHRIPRHVAPFRTTMDSDQMAGAIGGKAVDASLPDIRNSQGSTNVTDSSMPSVHSSVNSKSALLRNKGASTRPASKMVAGEDDAMPKRKTRRARDPYAIDLSDEEDEEEEEEDDDDDHAAETPRLPAKKEESLAEFLRNYDPPPEPVSSPPRLPKKKGSAPSLMGRFTRGIGKDKDKDSASIRGGQETRSVHSRASGRGYIPIQVNLPAGHDMFGPVDKTRSSVSRTRGTSIASSTTAARRPMKRFEPREAVTNHSQTADLAAFLRDSAPPPNNSPTVTDRAPSRQEESGGSGGGGIAKMFGRRKKPLAV